MGNIEIYNVEQGSNAWFDLRCGRITGSRFGTLMSGKSTKGYTDIINELAGEIISQTTEESYSNYDMERGIEMEPEAANAYAGLFDIDVEEVGFVTNLDLFPDYVGVSPDRIIGNGLLEIKCPKMKTHIGYLRANKLPSIYRYQVQGQLLVTGAEFCDFMSYYPGIKPFILRVEPDKEIHKAITERLEETINIIQETVNSLI